MFQGGVQTNCVPPEVSAKIDMRLSPLLDFDAFEKEIRSWCLAEDVELSFEQKNEKVPPTLLNDSNLQWKVLKQVAQKRNIALEPEIFPAATDSRFLRRAGIPAFGISAIRNTPVLLHDHNEYLNEKTLIEGIDFYIDLIVGLANI
jgi:aminoacylase